LQSRDLGRHLNFDFLLLLKKPAEALHLNVVDLGTGSVSFGGWLGGLVKSKWLLGLGWVKRNKRGKDGGGRAR
jgi:hypothetical protein